MLEYLELPLFLRDSLQVPWKKALESYRKGVCGCWRPISCSVFLNGIMI